MAKEKEKIKIFVTIPIEIFPPKTLQIQGKKGKKAERLWS